MKIRVFILVVAMFAITGCATSGKNFDESGMDKIVDGQTTKQEIEQWFGQPSGTHSGSDGRTAYTYTYAEAQARPESFIPFVGMFVGGTDSEAKTLTVWFDQSQVVDSHGFAQHSSRSGMF